MDAGLITHLGASAMSMRDLSLILAAGPVSPSAAGLFQVDWLDPLFRTILAGAAIVFLGVEGLLLYAVFRFRRSPDGGQAPSIQPRPTLELVWTLIPAILVIVIAVFSFRVLSRQTSSGEGGDVPSSQGMAEIGQSVFTTYGCSSCHTLKAVGAKGTVGPDLDGVGRWAGDVVAGMDAESFLHQAILEPNAHIANGYESGIMPTNFSSRLTPTQLSGLVTFLLAQE